MCSPFGPHFSLFKMTTYSTSHVFTIIQQETENLSLLTKTFIGWYTLTQDVQQFIFVSVRLCRLTCDDEFFKVSLSFFFFPWPPGGSGMSWAWRHSWCQESQSACCTTRPPKCTTVPTLLKNSVCLYQRTCCILMQRGNVAEQTRFVITVLCCYIGGNA